MRRYRPNRLIQLEGADELVDEVTRRTQEELRRAAELTDATWVGDLFEERPVLWESPQVMVLIPAPCDNGSSGRMVRSGEYNPRYRMLLLSLDPCYRISDWLEDRYARPAIEHTLLHELTHSLDLGLVIRNDWLRKALLGVGRDSKRAEQQKHRIQGWADYVNDPSEVKAFSRQVFLDVKNALRTGNYASSRYRRDLAQETTPEAYLRDVMVSSRTFQTLLERGLSEQNERQLLRDVYQELDLAGVLDEYYARWGGK